VKVFVNQKKVHEASYTQKQAKKWWAKNKDKLRKVWKKHPELSNVVKLDHELTPDEC